jgi:hypothetical protein
MGHDQKEQMGVEHEPGGLPNLRRAGPDHPQAFIFQASIVGRMDVHQVRPRDR